MSELTNRLFINLIRTYQTHLSPYKGYRCAHHFNWGEGSCSVFAVTALEQHCSSKAIFLIASRLKDCRATFNTIAEQENEGADKVKKNILDGCARCQAILCHI